ncbi:polysaccharide lyase 6 family protein [Planctomycetota bacterium]
MAFKHSLGLSFEVNLTFLIIVTIVFNGAIAGDVLVSTEEQLKAAITAAAPGDEILIQDGTFRDWRIRFRGFGTAMQPITLKAQTPGGVKLTGYTRVEISGSHLVVSGFRFENAHSTGHASIVELRGGDRCRLTECSFINCGDPESTFTRTINLAYGSRHGRVDHCFMTGTLSMGMGAVVRDSDAGRGNTDNRFDHNYFRDIRRLSSNGQEPIQLGQDQTAFGAVSLRTIVEYNLFEHASGDSEIISNKSADNIIRYNTLRDSKAGIWLRGGQNVLVEGNYCLRTRGIHVYGNGHTIVNNYLEETEYGICLHAGQYHAGEFMSREVFGSYQVASDVLAAHNTIVNPRGVGISLGSYRGQKHKGVERKLLPRRVRFVNNLITGQTGILINDEGGRNVEWLSNLAWPLGDAQVGLSHPGIVKADPKLTRHGIRFLPGPNSPVRDAGTSLPEVVTDYSSHKRTGLSDIGSDEVTRGEIIRRALQPIDVGPSWIKANSMLP